MNRSVKRSMENTERSPRQGRSRTAIDSASQRFVTVRQVFPDGPAPEGQASSRHFGGGPFPVRRLPGLAGAVLMNAAPLSERSNFDWYPITFPRRCQRLFPKKWKQSRRFVQIGEENGERHCALWEYYGMMPQVTSGGAA